jgi:hypothetical protein
MALVLSALLVIARAPLLTFFTASLALLGAITLNFFNPAAASAIPTFHRRERDDSLVSSDS